MNKSPRTPLFSHTLLHLICFLVISFGAKAQHTNFNTQTNWALNKKEIFWGGGITQFTGDLGGRNKLGPDHRLPDLAFPSTSWCGLFAYRYRFHPHIATVSKIQVGRLQGNDALKVDEYQNSRNLHFRSNFVELSQRIDVILLVNEKFSCGGYGLRRRKMKYYQLYTYLGLGLLMFDPQAEYNNNWVSLHALRTEGQGLAGGPKQYRRVTATVPLGIGFNHEISRMWKIGVELEHVFSFSDYLDDAGGVYYDPTVLAAEIGTESAALSNPAVQNQDWFAPGAKRGDVRLDGFFAFTLHIKRNITYKNYRGIRRSEERKKTKKED
ncbi:MAG: hypothetical protein NXI10_17720 [bacterium]|nr:hypothetical protein [bacterium]